MTAALRARVASTRRFSLPTRSRPAASTPAVLPPLSGRRRLIRSVAVVVLVLCASLLLHFAVVSRLQQSAAQQRSFDRFRADLANGVLPIGPNDADGNALVGGTPVAQLEIPALELSQVVVEGTSSGDLFNGPGHLRNTPLPGQAGTSAIVGRRAAYGGPFGQLRELEAGDAIVVTTGQGEFEYSVIGVRREGDPLPDPVEADGSRLVLATADGAPFIPEGVLRVDAELDGEAVGGAARSSRLDPYERLMAGDTNSLWRLALWLQALIAAAVTSVWAWHRWGRAQAWIVCFPPLMLIGLFTSGELARLLPNLT